MFGARKLILLNGRTKLILDQISGASVAYGLSRLSASYRGQAVNIRRTSDNAQQDIGFSGNVFNAAAFSAFVGGRTGFITKWYDQSGSGRDAAQTTAANQPTLVVSGGKPYINFPNDGSTTTIILSHASPAMAQPFSFVLNYDNIDTGNRSNRIWADGGPADLTTKFPSTAQAFAMNIGGGSWVASASSYNSVWVAAQAVANGASSLVRTNGAEATGNPGAGAQTAASYVIGADGGGQATNGFIGRIDTAIMFPIALSAAQRLTLEQWLQANANT